MLTLTVPQTFELAVQHHQAGRLADAEALYRQILAVQPRHAEALHFLGVIAHQIGRHDLAAGWIRQALVINPGNPAAHSNLGEACLALGRLDEAVANYRQALELKPDYPEAHFNLANALRDQGRTGEAVAAYRRALELQPAHAGALNNLGVVLVSQGQVEEGVDAYRQALELDPNYALAHNNLGNALNDRGYINEAAAAYHRAVQLKPDFTEAHYNLGIALARRGQIDEAVAAYRRALELKPDYADAHNNLGNAFKDLGLLDEAATAYRRAMQSNPEHSGMHSNLVYTFHFHPGHDDRTIAAEHQRWNRQFAEPLKPMILPHTNDRSPDRRLRVGYVSPDFRFQAEVFFVMPLLEAHDHRQFEIHAYASVAQPDDMTARLRRSADAWHDVQGFSYHDLAQQIRDDGIDILVDLTMHMAHNRLPVFARKPAPVQIAWLAYPGSTGLETMDYRLTDAYIDPPEVKTPYYSEHSVRLPDSWCCYHPLTDPPPVNPLPATTAARITFGCLNSFFKISDETVALFAGVLRAVEGSRLLLLAPEGSARLRILDRFNQFGVLRDRIEFVAGMSRSDYLALYHGLDIGLDPLPYNGITTTCDALWMGVPVVSLAGKTAAGRAGLSLLSTVGLSELAVGSPEAFVQAAKQLAGDLPGLASLREKLRPQMQASPLMDAPRFARNIEVAFRTMWQHWCAENQPWRR